MFIQNALCIFAYMITGYFDGACEPKNPNGHMGIGAILFDNDEIIHKHSKCIKFGEDGFTSTSNNVAEYLAFINLIEKLIELNYHERNIILYGDSKLVVEQMLGNWRIKKGIYVEHAWKAKKLIASFKKINIQWIPREKNQLADDLSKLKMVERGVEFKIQA